MTMDFTRLIDRLDPKPDGESPVRHRTGIVDAVNSDGTVDLILSGVVVPSVAVLSGASVNVGDAVQVVAWSGDLLVLGATRQNVQGTVQSYTPVLTATTTNPTRQTPGNGGIIAGSFVRHADLVNVWVRIVYGPSGSQGDGVLSVTLPFAAALGGGVVASTSVGVGTPLGDYVNRDDSAVASSTQGKVQLASSTTVRFNTAPTLAFLSAGGSISTTNDTLLFNAEYPAEP